MCVCCCFIVECSDGKKSLRPLRGHVVGSKQHTLHAFAKATLGSGDVLSAVALPEGEDRNEWLAVHTVDFFNEISLLYGLLTDGVCTSASCATMTAGKLYEYLWADGVDVVKPIKVSAPEYVDRLMTWIEGQTDRDDIFPTRAGAPYPPHFEAIVKNIFKRLFRVYAHVYHHHFASIVELRAEAHLNTCFKVRLCGGARGRERPPAEIHSPLRGCCGSPTNHSRGSPR